MSKDTFKDYVIERGESGGGLDGFVDGVDWGSTIDNPDESIVFDSRMKNGLRIESTKTKNVERNDEGRRVFYETIKREQMIVDTFNELKKYADECGVLLLDDCSLGDFHNFFYNS